MSDKLTTGKEIEQLILTNDQEMIDKAYVMLHTEMHQYSSGKFKKWMCLALGLVIAICMSPITVITLNSLLFAKYDRAGLESVAKEKFTEDLMFSDVG